MIVQQKRSSQKKKSFFSELSKLWVEKGQTTSAFARPGKHHPKYGLNMRTFCCCDVEFFGLEAEPQPIFSPYWSFGTGGGGLGPLLLARLIPPTRPSPPGLAWPGHSPFTFVVALGFISPFFHEKKATPKKVPIQNTVYVICTQFKKSLPKLVAKVITGENSQKKNLALLLAGPPCQALGWQWWRRYMVHGTCGAPAHRLHH